MDGIHNIKEYLNGITALYKHMGVENAHKSVVGLVLEHGKSYAVTKDSYKGRRAKAHQCYQNAGRLALDNSNLIYVEGYVAVYGIPIEHAWCANKQGQVIDPTLRMGRDAERIQGYFGIPFKTEYLMDTATKTGYWGLISYTNPDLLEQDKSVYLQE